MPQKYKLMSTGEVFEAEQLKHDNGMELVDWCGGRPVTEVDPFDDSLTFFGINVPTLAGTRRCSDGDYLVRSDNGYFHVVHKYEFEHTYRPCFVTKDEPITTGEVPLVQYDDDGNRRIIGRARVTDTEDGMRVEATLTERASGFKFDDWNSLSFNPSIQPQVSRDLAAERRQKFSWLSIKDESAE